MFDRLTKKNGEGSADGTVDAGERYDDGGAVAVATMEPPTDADDGTDGTDDEFWKPGRKSPAKTPAPLGRKARKQQGTDDDADTAADTGAEAHEPAGEAAGWAPPDEPKASPGAALRRTVREFGDDQCTDLAAGLTYYAVLSIFPALLAVFSILGVIGQGDKAVDQIVKVLRPLLSAHTIDDRIRPMLEQLVTVHGAGITLLVGLIGALWAASGYVGAFGRAMNRIYEVAEGRSTWKLRPQQLLLTLVTVVLCAASLMIMIASGPVAGSLGKTLGVGDSLLTVWSYAKWPLLAVFVIAIVALLYYFTPNVKQPKFRWVSAGAFVAILVWVVASVAFAFYVGNVGNYNKTYGSVAGVVIGLLWLWITNIALLFGAELDSELERSRQLRAGKPAEEVLQLPVRDDHGIVKAERKREQVVERARKVRTDAWGAGDPADRPFSKDRPQRK